MNTIWHEFAARYALSDQQLECFKRYAHELVSWNKRTNLTAITSDQGIIDDHFGDSLALSELVDLTKITSMLDIGCGAGFPSLPLKIVYDQLQVVLLEVNQKKKSFLEHIVQMFDLSDVEACDLDWRTFLRSTSGEIELFVARASLQPKEFLRLFAQNCAYNKSLLVYWASAQWAPSPEVRPFVLAQKTYTIGKKDRQLIVLGSPAAQSKLAQSKLKI